jgi:hypothetical protein
MEVFAVSAAIRLRNDRGDVLGVSVSAIAMADAIELIARWIELLHRAVRGRRFARKAFSREYP